MQIVTDKVWHELAFVFKKISAATAHHALRVAEIASYFGISTGFPPERGATFGR